MLSMAQMIARPQLCTSESHERIQLAAYLARCLSELLRPPHAALGCTAGPPLLRRVLTHTHVQVLAEHFFLGYRKVDLQPQEVLLRVRLPWTRPRELVREFKQSHRQDDDIAIVNAGMRMRLQKAASGAL